VGIRLASNASRRQVCTPTQNVRDALVKLEGLVQSWQAAVQEAQGTLCLFSLVRPKPFVNLTSVFCISIFFSRPSELHIASFTSTYSNRTYNIRGTTMFTHITKYILESQFKDC